MLIFTAGWQLLIIEKIVQHIQETQNKKSLVIKYNDKQIERKGSKDEQNIKSKAKE